MNFGDLLFALNCDPLKNKIWKIEKINKRIVETKNGIYFNYIYIYIYTTILPWSCTDGRYFYHISGIELFSGTNNSGFLGTIVIFLLYFGSTCPNQEIGFKWK